MEKQINRATGNRRTIPKEVTFASLVFQKEGKFFLRQILKVLVEIMVENSQIWQNIKTYRRKRLNKCQGTS